MTIASYVFGLITVNIDAGRGIKSLPPRYWVYVVVSVVLIIGVLRRSRVAWIAALVWELWSFIPWLLWLGLEPKDDVVVSTIFLTVGLSLLALLVHPLTRAWVRPGVELSSDR